MKPISTRAYFIQYGHKLRGRPTTTLPIVLNRDLGLIDHLRLQSTDDLVKISELAREISVRIEKAVEASPTMNWDATRQQVKSVIARLPKFSIHIIGGLYLY